MNIANRAYDSAGYLDAARDLEVEIPDDKDHYIKRNLNIYGISSIEKNCFKIEFLKEASL